MSDRKLLGCCTVCDEPIFEVAARWTEGPMKGEIKQVVGPLPGARRLSIVRASGNQSNWSLCGDCTVTPENISALNRKEIRAMVKEREMAKDTMEQSERRDAMLRLFQFDIPIGVLGEKPWAEVT